MLQLPRVGWRLLACQNGASPDCIIVVVVCCVVCAVVVVVVVVSDACSTVCLSTAVMPMQQSLKLIGGGSPGSRDSRRPRHPSCV